MDSTTYTISKQAASPFDGAGPPAPAVNNKPPYNSVQYGNGRHAANLYNRTFNQHHCDMNSWSIEGPTPHAPERYRAF